MSQAPRAAVHTDLASPLGRLLLAATPDGLALVGFLASASEAAHFEAAGLVPSDEGERGGLERSLEALESYFAGELRHFDLKLDLAAGTPFERRVWRETVRIPYGKVRSYGELAERLGAPLGARAVGRALARNPLAIVVPCHRVVLHDGSLGGYGGGPAAKRKLLAHEGFLLPDLGLEPG